MSDIEIKEGVYFSCQTRTQGDTFGDCIWKVIESGLNNPLTGKPDGTGVKCKLLGGSGPAASSGRVVMDTVDSILSGIEAGTNNIISPERATELEEYYADGDNKKRVGSGIEVDL